MCPRHVILAAGETRGEVKQTQPYRQWDKKPAGHEVKGRIKSGDSSVGPIRLKKDNSNVDGIMNKKKMKGPITLPEFHHEFKMVLI